MSKLSEKTALQILEIAVEQKSMKDDLQDRFDEMVKMAKWLVESAKTTEVLW